MKKAPTEKQSRAQLLDHARENGSEAELLKIFNRYDDLLKGCKTADEKRAIAAAGIVEIHNFFGGDGELTIDGIKIK